MNAHENITGVAVAGATGRVGRHVVDVLKARGLRATPMSRSTGVDVITGEGLADAVAGADCIIDVATGPSPDQAAATAFFTTAARNLHEAGAAAGVTRMVVVSIIGTDRFPTGYNAAKLAHERAALDGPIPATVVRAAQFHEFVEQLMTWGTQGDTAYVPEMRTQLVAARTVAEALVDAATGAEVPEVAGPREESLVAMARLLAEHRGTPSKVQGVIDPEDGERFADGSLLPGPGARLAGPTFEEWAVGSSSSAHGDSSAAA